MAIKHPIPISFNLDSQQSVQSVCAVIHIDDDNTEILDLSLMQGGEHIAVSPNSTVTARFVRVKDKILISDNVACTVQENGNIYIPIDNAAARMLVGEIKIEVNIVDENDVLTMQFPLVIKVNNTILADAEISPESEGTIPELLEEAREAAESATQAAEAATEAISTKQDKLTAGQNITITEENVISASSGSNDYTDLTNKPSINNVTLSGNKSSDDLSLQGKLTAGDNITIENNVISAEGGGAQIVSGVVNANGTITFTDSEGNSFTTSGESVIGADGFSPSATVQQTASGATITVTDKNGTTTANITNGQDGNDYVLTAQDKSDIADIVLNELPTTEGVLYGNTSN